jgi:hypothetical protein
VWKALAERDKVFDTGAFNGKALVHNLRDSDYGRTLSDLRAAFYSAPRLPLLFGGDPDLQQAIYDAVTEGTVDIIDGAGDPVAVTAPNQVNLTSAGLRLAKPKAAEVSAGSGGGASLSPVAPSAPGGSRAGDGGGSATPAPTQEQQVAFSFTRNLLGDDASADDLAALFKAVYQALDERTVSYGQGTLQLVTSGDVADRLSECLQALGITATVKPV